MRQLLAILALSAACVAACIGIEQAPRRVGAITCVSGKVTRITQGPNGVQYVDFCAEHSQCPFSGVVFAPDLRDVGDIRSLPGKIVEIHGQIREYDGHAEIIVNDARQLRGKDLRLPPVPKAYDVEQRGHFRAGSIYHSKAKKPPKSKRQPPLPPGGVEVPPDAPE